MPKPTLPVDVADLTRITGLRGAYPQQAISAEEVQTVLNAARIPDRIAVRNSFSSIARVRKCGSLGPLLMAIDPVTGDSALHIAAAAGNLEGLKAIKDKFGPLSRQPKRERAYHLFLTHQNHAGDTALHAAARAGRLDCAVGVYRMFCRDWLPGEVGREEGVALPAEEWVWGAAEVEADVHVPSLLFVCTKNNAGRDAAAEARSSGHEKVAELFEAILARLDPELKRMGDAEMQRMESQVQEWYHYGDEDDH